MGATYCADDTAVNVTAPYGYQGYTWYDSSLTNVIGTSQILKLVPPPPFNKTVAVKLEPYFGYGCLKTLYAELKNSLVLQSNAGPDTLSCNFNPVNIGSTARAGLVYNWTPAAGLNNPKIANPLAAPDKTTSYIVHTNNSGGGCRTTDTVVVTSSVIDSTVQLIGKVTFCADNGDSAILKVQPTTSIQWFKNDEAIPNAHQTIYKVNTSGSYYALLKNNVGCLVASQKIPVVIDHAKPGIRYPLVYAINNTPITLNARQIGESAVWRPASYLNFTNLFNPVFTGESETTYTIQIRTNTECITIDTQLVKTIKNIEIYVPSGFTPNNDGRNDYLRPIFRGIKEVRYFRVFNRWGQLLYESKDGIPGWDGNFKGEVQATQTVVWSLDCLGYDGKEYNQKGTTVLLR